MCLRVGGCRMQQTAAPGRKLYATELGHTTVAAQQEDVHGVFAQAQQEQPSLQQRRGLMEGHGGNDDEVNTEEVRPRSFGEIMSHFRDMAVDPAKIRPKDVDLVYRLTFGHEHSDTETELLRTEFLRRVGPAGARHLCRFVLHEERTDRVSDDHAAGRYTTRTDGLVSVIGNLFGTVKLLIFFHEDLAPEGVTVDFAIAPDGTLPAYAHETPRSLSSTERSWTDLGVLTSASREFQTRTGREDRERHADAEHQQTQPVGVPVRGSAPD